MKNKFLKIIFAVIITFGIFTFSNQVKASINVQNLPFTNKGYRTIIIPEYSGDVLMVCSPMGDSGGRYSLNSLYFNGDAFTKIPNLEYGAYSRIFYLKNPDIGAYNLTSNNNLYWQTNWPWPDIACFLLSGVDTDYPIVATSTGSTASGITYYNNGVNGNLLFAFGENWSSWSGWNSGVMSTPVQSSNSTILGNYGFVGNDVHQGVVSYTYINNIVQQISYTNQLSDFSMAFVEFNEAPPTEYCGDTFCQTTTENCSTCPIDCGECANNPNATNNSLFFFSNPYTFSNQSTAIVNYLYNEDVFTHYDHIEIRKLNSTMTSSTFVATSTIIDISGFYINKRDGKSFFTLTGDGTTIGYQYYEVIGHLAPYWSPTLGDVGATTTIPYLVVVNWQPTQLPDISDILSATSTNPFFDDSSMYYAACSDEEWNTPPPEIFGIDVPALNLTVIGCKFKLGFIIAGNKFTSLATDGIYRAGNILKNVFPFNIYTNLNDSWKASANKEVMSELSFLSPVNGNLTAQIPTTGTSTATVVLWGKDIFTSSSTLGTVNAQKTNQLFLAIKTIIKWALWGLFGFWVIKNGKAFIDKMTGGQ